MEHHYEHFWLDPKFWVAVSFVLFLLPLWLLALASACWTLPQVNAYPLFIEPIPRAKRGVLASLYLLAMALGGMIGDPMNGAIFDLLHGYRALFLLMAAYALLAAAAVWLVPRGAGEAGTGPDAIPPPARRSLGEGGR